MEHNNNIINPNFNSGWDQGSVSEGAAGQRESVLVLMLGFVDEDDEGDVGLDLFEEGGHEEVADNEEDDEEEIHPSGGRRNPVIDDQCDVSKRRREEDDE